MPPQYDIAVISEGSDEIAMTAFTLNTIKAGNVHGQTMRRSDLLLKNLLAESGANSLDDYLKQRRKR